jgi:hypothetical protein
MDASRSARRALCGTISPGFRRGVNGDEEEIVPVVFVADRSRRSRGRGSKIERGIENESGRPEAHGRETMEGDRA